MKRTLTMTLMTVAGLALLGQACNSSNNNSAPNPPNTTSKQTGPAWTISLKSACADGTDAASCVAYYGFTADADGNYKVGPSPANRTKVDKLHSDDRDAITNALKPFLNANHTAAAANSVGSQTCADVDPNSGNPPTTTDTITLTRQGSQPQVIVTSDPAKFCETAGTAEQAKALYAAVMAAAGVYYLLPFPDACIDAAASVTALYDSLNLRSCTVDADCAYVADDYSVIPADTEVYVAEDNCSQVTPLVVANAATTTTHQAALAAALSQAQDACADRMWRTDCLSESGFLSDTGAPLCKAHVCTKNPTAHPMY